MEHADKRLNWQQKRDAKRDGPTGSHRKPTRTYRRDVNAENTVVSFNQGYNATSAGRY